MDEHFDPGARGMDKLTAFSYAFVVLLTSICLFSVSFSLLAPLEMALKYNENIHLLNENTVYSFCQARITT